MGRLIWRECDICFLVTSDLPRHLKIAHNTRMGQGGTRNHLRKQVQTFAHLPFGPCFYCNHKEHMTSDHVIPMRMGTGFNRPWNRVPACNHCNFKKGGALPREWFDSLIVSGNAYANGPKRQMILARLDIIVHDLLERPELQRYAGWIRPSREPRPIED